MRKEREEIYTECFWWKLGNFTGWWWWCFAPGASVCLNLGYSPASGRTFSEGKCEDISCVIAGYRHFTGGGVLLRYIYQFDTELHVYQLDVILSGGRERGERGEGDFAC